MNLRYISFVISASFLVGTCLVTAMEKPESVAELSYNFTNPSNNIILNKSGSYSDINLPNHAPKSGKWRLGALSSSGPSIRIEKPVIGIGLDRLSRVAILTSAGSNAITFSVQKIREQSSIMPLGALEVWMKIAHPRIRESERVETVSYTHLTLPTSDLV